MTSRPARLNVKILFQEIIFFLDAEELKTFHCILVDSSTDIC